MIEDPSHAIEVVRERSKARSTTSTRQTGRYF